MLYAGYTRQVFGMVRSGAGAEPTPYTYLHFDLQWLDCTLSHKPLLTYDRPVTQSLAIQTRYSNQRYAFAQ